ncbi:hypothetical protein ACH9D2_10395 [Kocuria sp. M4R2S49]|uniref:hypothetical protein n=1 Tax=Kocuria rhizosphaericola TaxID=3376284 RepID=UPI00379DE17E
MAGEAHAALDRAATLGGALLPDHRKYFGETTDGATVAEHLAELSVEAPSVTREGEQELRARTRAGVLDPACMVVRWCGPDRPTVILHHGNNERPFAFGRTAKNTLGRAVLVPEPPDANVFLLRAPFHAGSLREFLGAMGSLDRFTAMLATSVALADLVGRSARAEGSPRVVLSGVSLGGWVVNLHRTHHNTADAYVPVFAGAALAEVFLTSAYRRLTSRRAQADQERIRRLLDFEDAFTAVPGANVAAMLARYDQYVDYDRQRPCYGDRPVTVLRRGHVTGSLATAPLREHVLSHVVVGRQGRGPDHGSLDIR